MKYLLMFLSLLLFGCASGVKIISDYNSENFNITNIKKAKVKVFVNTNLAVQAFEKSFASEYKSDRANFDTSFTNQLQYMLSQKTEMTFGDSSDVSSFYSNYDSIKQTTSIDKPFLNAVEKYFIVIPKVVISDQVTGSNPEVYNAPTTVSTPGGPVSFGGGFSGGGTKRDCVVAVKVDVWLVKERKRVSSFTAFGGGYSKLFQFDKVIQNNIKEAIENLANYIDQNRMQ